MQEILFLRGLPASGKTSFALETISNNPKFKRINKDDIRAKYNEGWSKKFEKRVLKEQRELGNKYLEEGHSLIVDDTNFNNKHYVYWYDIATVKGIKFTMREFDTSVEECIRRDSLRENPVGEKVILRMHKQRNKLKIDSRYIKMQNDLLPDAIICDIDGTIALMDGRNPYVPTMTDKLNFPVSDIIAKEFWDETAIILVSGRSEKYREVTEKWLDKHNVKYDKLIMREFGDNRPDEVIKREIYLQQINNKFYIKYVLDDRDKVVRMWRDEGLLCLQVYYGNF